MLSADRLYERRWADTLMLHLLRRLKDEHVARVMQRYLICCGSGSIAERQSISHQGW
jgi:hypothetical protein